MDCIVEVIACLVASCIFLYPFYKWVENNCIHTVYVVVVYTLDGGHAVREVYKDKESAIECADSFVNVVHDGCYAVVEQWEVI